MKKFMLAFAILTGMSQFASAMPCDTGYLCQSSNGKYQIELNRCRYANKLGLVSMKVNGSKIEKAKLGAAYDGLSVGGSVLAFEVVLPPPTDGSLSVISVETSNNGKGKLQNKFTEYMPAPNKVLETAKVTCEVTE